MSYIKKIVDYFFHHDLPEEMNWKIHRRLLKKEDRPEVDEALQSVWDTMGFPEMNEARPRQAYSILSRNLGFTEQKKSASKNVRIMPFWVKLTAI